MHSGAGLRRGRRVRGARGGRRIARPSSQRPISPRLVCPVAVPAAPLHVRAAGHSTVDLRADPLTLDARDPQPPSLSSHTPAMAADSSSSREAHVYMGRIAEQCVSPPRSPAQPLSTLARLPRSVRRHAPPTRPPSSTMHGRARLQASGVAIQAQDNGWDALSSPASGGREAGGGARWVDARSDDAGAPPQHALRRV